MAVCVCARRPPGDSVVICKMFKEPTDDDGSHALLCVCVCVHLFDAAQNIACLFVCGAALISLRTICSRRVFFFLACLA